MEESVIVTKQGGPLLPGGSFAAVMPPSHHYVPTTVLSSGYRFAVLYIRACVFVCMRYVPLPPSPHATFELKSREFFFVQPDGAHTHGWPTFLRPLLPYAKMMVCLVNSRGLCSHALRGGTRRKGEYLLSDAQRPGRDIHHPANYNEEDSASNKRISSFFAFKAKPPELPPPSSSSIIM